VDETGWTGKEKSARRVIAPKDAAHVFKRKTTMSGHTTAQVCISGGGRFLPTMVVFQVRFILLSISIHEL